MTTILREDLSQVEETAKRFAPIGELQHMETLNSLENKSFIAQRLIRAL